MNNKVKKAIILAGGYGTRMLPFTKTVPKEMLPLSSTPVIEKLVSDCIKSNVEEIYIITRPDTDITRTHWLDNDMYKTYLKNSNKDISKLEQSILIENTKITFISEPTNISYGDAVGIILLKNIFCNENRFLVLFADDYIFTKKESGSISHLIQKAQETRSAAIISVVKKDKKEIMDFGNIFIKDGTENELSHIVRKPSNKTMTSNLAMCGQMILSPIIYEYYDILSEDSSSELDTAVAIGLMAKKHTVEIAKIDGDFVTVGDPLNYLKANIYSSIYNKQITKKELIKYVKYL